MNVITEQTERIRNFICKNLHLNSAKLTNLVVEKFSISRQAVNVHLKNLVKEKIIQAKRNGKSIDYSLRPILEKFFEEKILKNSSEYTVRDNTIEPIFEKLNLPKNVFDIWMYGFSEMVNNLIDHSGSKIAEITFLTNFLYTEIKIRDIGIGIFKNLENNFQLIEPQYALLELFKGKLTSDPSRHSGEGIFFTSRMFDFFRIRSGFYSLSKDIAPDLWVIETMQKKLKGTEITLRLDNHSERQINDVFFKYVVGDDFKFAKTDVRIQLAEYGDEYLVSRSQAKRILLRLEKFTEVMFDFKNIENIGPAFADELFRVSKNTYPKLEIRYSNAGRVVEIFIKKALNADK